MNYMEKVAQMLGVRLEEEFYLKGDNHIYKFSTNRLLCLADNKKWIIATLTLTLILTGKREIVKKPILDEKEKEYLNNLIKPFSDRVISISKCNCYEYEYIVIMYLDIGKNKGHIYLPCFKRGTMYKGMEVGKEYSLEDLEL